MKKKYLNAVLILIVIVASCTKDLKRDNPADNKAINYIAPPDPTTYNMIDSFTLQTFQMLTHYYILGTNPVLYLYLKNSPEHSVKNCSIIFSSGQINFPYGNTGDIFGSNDNISNVGLGCLSQMPNDKILSIDYKIITYNHPDQVKYRGTIKIPVIDPAYNLSFPSITIMSSQFYVSPCDTVDIALNGKNDGTGPIENGTEIRKVFATSNASYVSDVELKDPYIEKILPGTTVRTSSSIRLGFKCNTPHNIYINFTAAVYFPAACNAVNIPFKVYIK